MQDFELELQLVRAKQMGVLAKLRPHLSIHFVPTPISASGQNAVKYMIDEASSICSCLFWPLTRSTDIMKHFTNATFYFL